MEGGINYLGEIQKLWLSWDEAKKAKFHLELNLAENTKHSIKCFCKYRGDKSKTRQNMSLLLNETVDIATWDTKRDKVLNAAFVSVFTSKTSFQKSQVPDTTQKCYSKEDS